MNNGPTQIAFLAIIMRILLFCFGGNNWFVGYCVLYIVLIIMISKEIINKRWPMIEEGTQRAR